VTRTVTRYTRLYQNGYDLSGEVLAVGDLDWDYGFEEATAWNWDVRGGLFDRARIATGTANTILRVEDDGFSPHDTLTGWQGSNVALMLAVGMGSAPALGSPAWCAVHEQKRVYLGVPAAGLVTVSLDYSPATAHGSTALAYDVPWGVILHPLGAETAVSTATGHDGGAASTGGGWMMAQITAIEGEGTPTIKVQHAETNSNASFTDVAGLSVPVAHTDVPCAKIAQAATNTTINRYTRFQLADLTGITSISFVLAFMRGR
jgi:hypothetical protein